MCKQTKVHSHKMFIVKCVDHPHIQMNQPPFAFPLLCLRKQYALYFSHFFLLLLSRLRCICAFVWEEKQVLQVVFDRCRCCCCFFSLLEKLKIDGMSAQISKHTPIYTHSFSRAIKLTWLRNSASHLFSCF